MLIIFITSLFFFGASTAFGLRIWQKLCAQEKIYFSQLPHAFVIGTLTLTLILFVMSCFLGRIEPFIIFLTITAVLIVSLSKLRRMKWVFPALGKARKLLLLLYIFAAIYLWYVFSRLLFYENGNLMAGWITVWGDWQAHFTYTSSFAYADNFIPQLPTFAGRLFSYPFMSNFLSALLVKLAMPMEWAIIVPSYLFTLSSIALFGNLVFRITRKNLTVILATLIFFGNGGLGFLYAVTNSPHYYGEMTKLLEENIQWMSTMTTQFIPQRGFNHGFPLALIILALFVEIFLQPQKRRYYFVAGFLTALLPLYHMHSFLAINFIAAFLVLKTLKHWKNWFLYAFPIVLLAVGPIIYFYGDNKINSFFRFRVGWMSGKDENVGIFLLKNYGVMLFLPLIGFLSAKGRVRALMIPFLIIGLLSHLFIFQPWEWDNTKYITYFYVGAAVLAGILLSHMYSTRNRFAQIFALLLLTTATFSGFHDIYFLSQIKKHSYVMFNPSQQALAAFVRQNLPPKSIFLTADNHDNPIPSLTGHEVLLGYPGWLWSYGIDYGKRQHDIEVIKKGLPEAAQLLQQYNVAYVVIGPTEIYQNFNKNYFDTHYPKIYSNETNTIYAVTKESK